MPMSFLPRRELYLFNFELNGVSSFRGTKNQGPYLLMPEAWSREHMLSMILIIYRSKRAS